MSGLVDMEELISTVSDKDVADYLREAFMCYGTGAYRACIVLSHTALFDGLRRKVKALAPVNAVAKNVSDEIEPLANAQKVFETQLIHKLRVAAIISQLEAQILEQLNNQRNKAAHPSGHVVTAEEARYVFAEAIQKFLSKPIRETSYVIDQIIGKIGGHNFFPSQMTNDMAAVVDQEIGTLDKAAMPFLVARLVQAWDGADPIAANNAKSFLLTLALKRDHNIRGSMIKSLIDPKSSEEKNVECFSMLATCDPELLMSLQAGTKLRYQALLLKNAVALGVAIPYPQLRNPAHVLGACLKIIGEEFMLAEMKDFTDWVIEECPYAPEFIVSISQSPKVFAAIFAGYLKRASSSQWGISNTFASAAPSMDSALALVVTDQQAFQFLAAIVRGAEWNGFGPMELANNAFSSLPNLKAKAVAFAAASTGPPAAPILKAQGVELKYEDFVAKYLT
jgi:hypothetical protein